MQARHISQNIRAGTMKKKRKLVRIGWVAQNKEYGYTALLGTTSYTKYDAQCRVRSYGEPKHFKIVPVFVEE